MNGGIVEKNGQNGIVPAPDPAKELPAEKAVPLTADEAQAVERVRKALYYGEYYRLTAAAPYDYQKVAESTDHARDALSKPTRAGILQAVGKLTDHEKTLISTAAHRADATDAHLIHAIYGGALPGKDPSSQRYKIIGEILAAVRRTDK
ncbi:MAG: hypothetical protein PHG85_00290 [Candidatus Altiarchaeota archaeon]|nr:hypothetical protein [Candidatus Altiarchaeota archaeon]